MVNIGVSGTYALDASGRGTGTINNGAAGMLNLALYPTINGIQVLETDSGKVVSGAIFPQSDELSSTNLQGSYGFNYTGASLTARGEVDAVASLTANGRGGITGLVDINDVGSISSGTSLNGSYSLDSSGRGSLTLQSEIGQQNAAIYAVSGNQALFIDLDQTLIAVGVIEHQVIEHK
jgi:hypothetical protein